MQAADGEIDRKAFAVLVNEHHRCLLAYALALVHRPSVAEDLVQEAFLTAYQKLSGFDARRDFGAWVRGIVRNKFREWVRRQQETPLEDEVLDALDRQHQRWDREPSGRERLFDLLQSCLQKLPDLLHQAVDCFYIQQLSGAQAAVRLSVGQAVVRKRLQRARQQLGKCIRQEMENPHG